MPASRIFFLLNRPWSRYITHAIQRHADESWAVQCHNVKCLRVQGLRSRPSTFGRTRPSSPLCCSACMRRQPDVLWTVVCLVLECTGCAAVPYCAVGVPVDTRTRVKPQQQAVAGTTPVTAGGFSSSSLSQAYLLLRRGLTRSRNGMRANRITSLPPNRQG